MREHEAELRAAGAALAAVGTGDPAYAQAFKRERHISFPLLLDEQALSYRVVEAGKATRASILSLSTVRDAVRAIARGNMQGRTGNRPLQLGATHVIEPDGTVRLAWRNTELADNAPVPLVLEALGTA